MDGGDAGAASHRSRPPTAAAARPRVPNHPPYAEMVREALRALAEPGGSSERAISDYIVSSFSGLPPGHDKLLPFYLRKLVSSSYLGVASPGRYLLCAQLIPGSVGRCHPESSPSTRAVVAQLRRQRGRPRKHPLTLLPRNKAISVPLTYQREESSSSAPVPAAAILQQQPQTEGVELRQSEEESSEASAAIISSM